MRLQRRSIFVAGVAIISSAILSLPAAWAQKPGAGSKPPISKPEYSLRISTRDLITLSLKAEKASLSKVAGEIAQKLKIAVLLGPSLQKQVVTTDFKTLTLEQSMNMLAPQVYIDYELNHSPGMQARPLAIYLNGYDDAAPAINTVVPNNSQAILIEGDTEEGLEDPKQSTDKEDPLRVVYERNYLTVKANQQPLSVVLYRIATELGIPLEIRSDASEVVNLDIKKVPLEDAVLQLSPNVRLYVRADLQKLERKPFRMVLVASEKQS